MYERTLEDFKLTYVVARAQEFREAHRGPLTGDEERMWRSDASEEFDLFMDQVRRDSVVEHFESLEEGAVNFTPTGKPLTHGTENAYNNHGCRCSLCREAHRLLEAKRREKRKNSDNIPHGTANGYHNYGCRCDLCKAAVAKKPKESKEEFPW